MPYALIVEKEQEVADFLRQIAESIGFTVDVILEIKQALLLLQQRPVTVMIVDGIYFEAYETQILQASFKHSMKTIVVTPYANNKKLEKKQKKNEISIFIKPLDSSKIRTKLSEVLDQFHSKKNNKTHSEKNYDFAQFIGKSSCMEQLYRQIEKVAKTEVPVLLIGESGTGKELAAQAIHQYSNRTHQILLPVNCGAISTHLIESELFGHEKGSFTGADKLRQGYFELAHQGTLFLDEITEMPLGMQVRLLRVLETGQFMRIGSGKPMTTAARLIAATNRDPLEAIANGHLREDLYYRLNVFPIRLPLLKTRGEDIILLAQRFLDEMNTQHQTDKHFSAKDLESLLAYTWPGNVRELRNVVWRAYIMSENAELDLSLNASTLNVS